MLLATQESLQKAARDRISEWYSNIKAEDGPRTPNRVWRPYFESPTDDKGVLSSPEYKAKASGVGTRESLPRKPKDIVNVFRSATGDTNACQEALSGGDVGDNRQEGSGGMEGTKNEGEGHRRPGRKSSSYLTDSGV